MIRHTEKAGPAPVGATDFAETIALCNRVLRPQGPPTIADEYPHVLAPANADHMWIIKSRGRIVSHAATYASTMDVADGLTLRMGGVSSVATDPAFRHRGYASDLVRACCADLQAQGCHFAVLWTEVKAFYEKLGFRSLGSELLYRLTPADLRDVRGNAEIRAACAEDVDALRALRDAQRPVVRRTPAEWEAFLRIPKTQVWVSRRAGSPPAYLAVGKGEDFRNCAHEWAGPARDVVSLLAHATRRSLRRELILLAPDDAGPVNAELQERGTPHIRTDLGMFRCLDVAATAEAIGPWLEARIGARLAVEPEADRWRLRLGDATVGPVSRETFSELLLGPRRARTLLRVSPEVGHTLERALPLPLFIWGFDSV